MSASAADRWLVTPPISYKGGRNCRGPATIWLIANKVQIDRARAQLYPTPWVRIAELAAADGVRNREKQPYGATALRAAWFRNIIGRAPRDVRGSQTPAQLKVATVDHAVAVVTANTMPRVRTLGDDG